MELPSTEQNEKHLRNIAMIVYGLQAVSFFLGITLLIGVIIGYVKKGDSKDSWLESHFKWQIRTFWWVLGLMLLSGLFFAIGLGFILLAGTSIWFIYRIIKGGLYLYEGRPLT